MRPSRSSLRLRARALAFAATALLLAACDQARHALDDRLDDRTPHERYARRLDDADLDEGPLGRRWLAAAERALRQPLAVSLPHRETAYFPATEPRAAGYRLALRRGERLIIELRPSALEPGELFLDLFHMEGDDAARARLVHVASGRADGPLEVEIERDGAYVVRVQPEALFEVRYALVMRTTPTLAFPVPARDDRAVRSVFGAARDGGRRSHAGIDIFAPRGTPVVAATSGWVRRVHSTALGGKVVWIWDGERGQSLYYAHLDRQLASEGQRVERGDTIGLVGNTGNARTTPPHLHFGIYRRGRGAVDPFPFVRQSRGAPPEVAADTAVLGAWRRVRAGGASMRLTFRDGASQPLPPGTALVPLGAAGGSYRVALPDERQGWVAATVTEDAAAPMQRVRATVVRSRPASPALAVDSASDAVLPVLGRFGDRLLVRTGDGAVGWVTAESD